MTTATQTFKGRRMLDVRVQIAQAGGGLDHVVEHSARDYTIYTQDGRAWSVLGTDAGWSGKEL